MLQLWQRISFITELGTDDIFPAKRIAIATIFNRLDPDICARYLVSVYEECQTLPELRPPFIRPGDTPQPRLA